MANEIAKQNNTLKVVQDNTYEQFLGANFPNIEEKTKVAFLEMAKAFNLNPFKREIYLVGYKGKQGDNYNIIVGYEVYISRAMASGMLDGWQVDSKVEKTFRLNANTGQFEEIIDLVATCAIWRKDFSQPFKKSVNFSEYAQKTFDYKTKTHRINHMWAEKPKTMLEKVATAQAFRLAFPAELGGIGYQAEELGHDSTIQSAPIREVRAQNIDKEQAADADLLTAIDECDDIDYLNQQLREYFANKNPVVKKAIWNNAQKHGYYYDAAAKKFLPESPIIDDTPEDEGNMNEHFEAVDAFRIRLGMATDADELEKITHEICAKYSDAQNAWPDGLLDFLNDAIKKVRDGEGTKFSEEEIF